jgi:hypothetical protein
MQIATLIPAFKPQYLPELLLALRQQTVKPASIVFSDDTPDGRYRDRLMSAELAPLRDGLPIECVIGPRQGAWVNTLALLERWNGSTELMHLLLDDDVPYPVFYERHLAAHATADLSCSISARWTANEVGQPLSMLPIPAAVVGHPNRALSLDASLVFGTTVAHCRNWFGEFSNAVFRGDIAQRLQRPEIGGVSYSGLWDLGAFLAASEVRPLAYLQDPLGYFRTSTGSNSSQVFGPYVKGAHIGYAALALGGERAGRLAPDTARQVYATMSVALQQRFGTQDDVMAFVPVLARMAEAVPDAPEAFVALWSAFQRLHRF